MEERKKKKKKPQSCYTLLSKYLTNVCKTLERCFGNTGMKYWKRVSVIYLSFTCPRTPSFPGEHNDLAQLEAPKVRFLPADILIILMDILGTRH